MDEFNFKYEEESSIKESLKVILMSRIRTIEGVSYKDL
jgi:hypothetical protein